MRISTLFRIVMIPAIMASSLVGCSSSGTTQDTAPTAPPLTAESLKTNAADINAGAGGLNKAPGVMPKR